jgi:nitrogen regulatory protein P-II 1
VKEIKAVIQPRKLSRVREAMRRVPGFPGMTVFEAEGCSALDPGAGLGPGIRAALTDYSRKVRIEVVCEDPLVEPIVAAITSAAHTGQKGDGILWVTEVTSVRRLREG